MKTVDIPETVAHHLTLVESTGEQDGGDPWIHPRTLAWDNRDLRLVEEEYHTSVTGSHHRITRRENAWDAMGKRYQRGVYKVNKTTGDDDPRHFIFDNQWRPIEEHVDDAVKTHFAWSPFDRWSLIRRKRTVTTPLDETLFLLKDYLDPAAIINTSGVVQERFAFDAFGPHRFLDPDFEPTGDAFAWNFLFHAEFLDPESGLYNYGFRYYYPDLGRWLSRDPVGEYGGINLYRANRNAPCNYFDRYGVSPGPFPGVAPGGVACADCHTTGPYPTRDIFDFPWPEPKAGRRIPREEPLDPGRPAPSPVGPVPPTEPLDPFPTPPVNPDDQLEPPVVACWYDCWPIHEYADEYGVCELTCVLRYASHPNCPEEPALTGNGHAYHPTCIFALPFCPCENDVPSYSFYQLSVAPWALDWYTEYREWLKRNHEVTK